MAGFSWPGDLGWFQDIADKFFSDANESDLKPVADEYSKLAGTLEEQLQSGDDAYNALEGAYQANGKASDALSAVKQRRANYRKQAGAFAAEALAGQQFMQPTAQVISDSKSADTKAGYDAMKKAHETQYWPDWMLHAASKETKIEEAKKQLEGEMSSNMNARVQKLQGTYKPPADGDYGFDGHPTSWNDESMDGSTFKQANSDVPTQQSGGFKQASSDVPTQQSGGFKQASSDVPTQQSGGLNQANSDVPTQQSGGFQQSGAQSPASSSGGGSTGAGGSGGGGSGGGSGAPSGGASTGLQSGGAVAEHAAPAAPTQAAGSGGGGGGLGGTPSIGGIGGGSGGGPGQPARIGGISGGPGGEGQRTGVQGGSATEKSAGSSSSSGSGSQGSGLSKGGGGIGAGAAGASTQAQSAQQAALRDAVRTGDTAAGAGRAADHAAARADVLGTGRSTELSVTALQAAHGQVAVLSSAFGGLEGSLASTHPASGAGELAGWIVNGGRVVGAGQAGFLSDGITWGRVERPPFDHVALTGLVLLFEDTRVAPNESAGVFRPVTARVTTTGWLGELDPAMQLPQGTRVLDRSKAPAGTDHLTDPGHLAVGLAKWLLDTGLDGDKSWRLVAVCFLDEPDHKWVNALATMAHQVESYWPGRPGYDLGDTGQKAVEDARTLSSEELAVKQSDPLKHAQDVARLAPDGLYDPAGLPAKEAEWYRKSAERANTDRITNARWKQELDQYLKEERGGGGMNW